MLNKNDNLFVSDFDIMMEKKKDERKRCMSRRKKEVTDIINSSDDRILYMISQMKEAADEDKVGVIWKLVFESQNIAIGK